MKEMKQIIILFLLVSTIFGCGEKKSSDSKPYMDKAEEMFSLVWSQYRVPQYGLFAEHYPGDHKPDLNYFQNETRRAQESSYLWPMSGLFSSVILLYETDSETYGPYLDSMVMAVEQYYDTRRTPSGYQAYPVQFGVVDRYYDDNGLVGIDYIDAYTVTGNPVYLAKAKEVMTFIMSGWWDEYDGAVSWLEGHKDQKPACSNGKATVLALKLYEATRDEQYLEQGVRFYNWMMKYLFDDSLHIVWNSLLTEKGEVQKHAYTYNTGTMIQSAVRLYHLTGERKYLDDARTMAEGSYDYYVKFTDTGTPYISDLPWFVIVLFRGYHELYDIDGNSKYVDAIIRSADWAWEHARDNAGLIYNDWTGRSDEYVQPKWLLDEACMIEMYTRAAMIKATSCDAEARKDVSRYVNPNIGSIHSRWFFYTPASEPFGMAKLGASTNGSYGNEQGWEAVGYEDGHTSIDGFPCFHEFQIGGVSLMPVTGKIIPTPGILEDPDKGYRSRFDKKDEVAKPGYYSVLLKDYGVKVELTATARVGFQQYTFPASDESHILFDIGNRWGESGAVRDAFIKHEGKTISGYVITEPEYVKKYQTGASVPLYFYAQVSKAPQSVDVFYRNGEPVGGHEIQGTGAMMSLNYQTKKDEKIQVKVGLSYTSVANAKLNLETEAASLDFAQALKNTTAKWEKSLRRIYVTGGTEESKIKFYTGLYHALLGRGLASDVNGAYPKNDGTVGQIQLNANGTPKHHHYNTDAIWGAYWNLTTLWAIAYPEYYNDWVSSQLLVYKDAGWLGDGIAASKYVSGVGTNMVSIAIAGAYNSGIRGFDVEEAYRAALKNELGWEGRIEGAGKMDTKQFVLRGYSPYENSIFYGTHPEGSTFSASHTMEYSFSAYAVAQWAKALGKTDDYHKLMNYSRGWQHLFNDELKLIHPKDVNGQFLDNFNPLESWRGFQEGNAMQYTFYVPHDPAGLIVRMGKDEFNHRLDSIFTEARKSIFGGGKVTHAFSGLQSPYNHGNQPSLHISWLFNFSGKPYLTQQWTRLICDEFYGTDGEHGYGYGQDEDQGQLGAWYVLSAIGLLDVQGGTPQRPTFQIGSPQFDKVEITLSPMNASGKSFTIEAIHNGPENYYIQSAELNGNLFDNCWLYRDELYKGGLLKLQMGAVPNKDRGIAVPPPSPQ